MKHSMQVVSGMYIVKWNIFTFLHINCWAEYTLHIFSCLVFLFWHSSPSSSCLSHLEHGLWHIWFLFHPSVYTAAILAFAACSYLSLSPPLLLLCCPLFILYSSLPTCSLFLLDHSQCSYGEMDLFTDTSNALCQQEFNWMLTLEGLTICLIFAPPIVIY